MYVDILSIGYLYITLKEDGNKGPSPGVETL